MSIASSTNLFHDVTLVLQLSLTIAVCYIVNKVTYYSLCYTGHFTCLLSSHECDFLSYPEVVTLYPIVAVYSSH